MLDPLGFSISDTDITHYNLSEHEQHKLIRWFWVIVSNFSTEEEDRFVNLCTGSSSLPSCGFKDLSPKFTISISEPPHQPPKYYPSLNTIAIGNHSTFDKFEKTFIESLYSQSELEALLSTKANESMEKANNMGEESGADFVDEMDYSVLSLCPRIISSNCTIS